MPCYSYKCSNPKCGELTESFQSIKDYTPLVKCPKCKKKTLIRNLKADLPSGSVKKGDDQLTVGELAKRNTERFSRDYKEHLHNERYKYRENPPKFTESKAERKKRELREFASGLKRTPEGKKNGKRKKDS